MKTTAFKVMGYIFVRPIRYLFHRMICASCGTRWMPEKHEFFGWQYPNFHWRLLYLTVFKFFKWLSWDAWRPFCDWTGGMRRDFPWYARAIKWLGDSTAGMAISGGRCFHCNYVDGDPVDLSEEDSEYFELIETGTEGTPDGTDHWFRGITTCPRCGWKPEHSDGSL